MRISMIFTVMAAGAMGVGGCAVTMDDDGGPGEMPTTEAGVDSAGDTGTSVPDGQVAPDTSMQRDTGTDATSPRDTESTPDTAVPADTGTIVDTGSTPDTGTARDTGVDTGHGSGPCVPTVGVHGENTNELCSNGIDDDCNGYTDCADYDCSRYTASVTVCGDAGTHVDAGTPDTGTPDTGVADSGPPGAVGPMGGTVSLLHFGVFGDVRPPSENDTSGYPTSTIRSVMQGMEALHAQFAVASGDYMFATSASAVTAQIDALLSAETLFSNTLFHGMGNHECNGSTNSNCPLGTEYTNVVQYLSRLATPYGHPYFDWVIHTSLGDAHFISTAPNAWSTTQETWLRSALAQSATYTFVLAHESPDASGPPAGSAVIESMIGSRSGGITLRLYGHTHEYNHLTSVGANAVVDGNAGAPLDGSGTYFGFGIVDQQSDGSVTFTAYQIGSPPMVVDTWSVNSNGTAHH